MAEPRFSQRMGYTPLSKALQRESMDDDLRNRLWSVIDGVVWRRWTTKPDTHSRDLTKIVDSLLDSIWIDFYKWPLDTRSQFKDSGWSTNDYSTLRHHYFDAQWYEVLDFIEFVIRRAEPHWSRALKTRCNRMFEEENAAYRIVDNRVVEMTDETEIAAVDEALSTPLDPIATHLKRAVALLSDKQKPDYTNSVKESVLAVEACCQYLVGDSKATLGQALKKVGGDKPIHPALKKGFSAIYGYAGDSAGIRHALSEGDEPPTFADAKFMLVACSAFVNYLMTQAAETGVEPGG